MNRPLEILLVEDNPGDVRLLREACRTGGVRCHLAVVGDGVEALELLRGKGQPHPDVVLLDLALPRQGGLETLAEIKSDPALKRIPVVVFCGSSEEKDVLAAYEHHANCYIAKPDDPDELVAVMRSIETFWTSFVRLPPE